MPNAPHIGCNFHFVNTIYRQIQNLQLTTVYRDNEAARSTARKLMALALVPYETIGSSFKLITQEAPHSMKPLLEYFNGYWLTKIK